MARDEAALLIKKWDPAGINSAAIATALRSSGWGPSYSTTGGDTPARTDMNQMFRELTAMGFEINTKGVLEHSLLIDYEEHAVVQDGGRLYIANTANGPTDGNEIAPTTSGQTLWDRITGNATEPDQLDDSDVVKTAGDGFIDLEWPCVLDGGSVITEFRIQWATQAGNFSSSQEATVTRPTYRVTGLNNGTIYKFRILSTNAIGDSLWSDEFTDTPLSQVPNDVDYTQLVNQTSGILASWPEPDDNGDPIIDYQLEWDTDDQFGSPTQVTVSGTSRLITGVSDGTTIYARVRARNGQGYGGRSPVASITRDNLVAVPDAPNAPMGEAGRPLLIDWTWNSPQDNGGQILDYRFQWRVAGDAWANANRVTVTSTSYSLTVPSDDDDIEARVQAHETRLVEGHYRVWGLWTLTISWIRCLR